MTGGQTQLFGVAGKAEDGGQAESAEPLQRVEHDGLRIVKAAPEETAAHELFLDFLAEQGDCQPIWRRSEQVLDA